MIKLKLVADDKIPYVRDFFTQCNELVFLPGEKITHDDLKEADILLTRTVTPVNAALLENTRVQFVGSATTGADHIDDQWLAKHHITLATAAGANSQAVSDYVIGCVTALKKQHKVAGMIGCGRIGAIVATRLQALGLTVIGYDPFLSEAGFPLVSLDKLMREADLISIHTPLTIDGAYPTLHMINDALLSQVKPDATLINTARGGVIDQAALLRTEKITLCLDVWENEPAISLALLHKVTIGTPHIAGYSVEAKYRATEMIYEKAAAFFNWDKRETLKNTEILDKKTSDYDPVAHTKQFRAAFLNCKTEDEIKKVFTMERKNYPLR